MTIFDKRTFSVVADAVQNAKTEVNFTKTWQRLHDNEGIGEKIAGKKLELSATDRQILCQLAIDETGANPESFDLSTLSTATRIETAGKVKDEKWTLQKVRKDIISIRAIDHEVQLLTGSYSVPTGGYIALPWKEVLQHKHQTVVAIENLEVFLVAEKINWPDDIRKQNPLLVYRGDPEFTPKAVKKFLENGQPDYFVFFDYDPAGLMMALTMPGSPSLIVPNMSSEQLIMHKHSILSVFEKQVNARKFLDKREESDALTPYINQMLKNHLAVMQERMVSFDMALSLVVVSIKQCR